MMRVEYLPKHRARVDALLKAARVNGEAFKADCERILVEGNTRDRLKGVDAKGKQLPKWKWRVGYYENRKGPTLAPFFKDSRVITAFYTKITGQKRGDFRLSAGFEGEGVEILVYHAEGVAGKGRPVRDENGKVVGFRGVRGKVTGIVRDVFGVSRETRKELYGALRRHADATFMGRIRQGVRLAKRTFYTRVRLPIRRWRNS